MLLTIKEFGGIAPRVKDPALLPVTHSQAAQDCRFDEGGIKPLSTDLFIQAATKSNTKSLFLYYNAGQKYFFEWETDVDAVKTPLANDYWNRVFYAENGRLRVTDKFMFNEGGTQYPMTSLNPSPLAPTLTPMATPDGSDPVQGIYIIDAACAEPVPVAALELITDQTQQAIGTYALIFTGGSGIGAAGTYTVENLGYEWNNITSVTLTGGGNGYTSNPIVVTQDGAGAIISHRQNTDGTYALIFSGGGGHDAAGTYTLLADQIIAVALANGGSGYTSAPSVLTQHALGRIGVTTKDLTLQETRGYVYTLVNKYGSEGPPSLVSPLIDVFDGDSVTISGMDVTADADYAIVFKRIYRTNTTASGSSQFQFVAEIGISTSSYTDLLLNADLAEVLASVEWEGAPAGIKGLIALPGQILAGFVDNIVCFSVPRYPHAWPASYQQPSEFPIVGLSSFGTTVAVLTEGLPYLVIGNDPATFVMEKVEGLSCVSKRGIVRGDQVTLYPSPQGISAIGSGVSQVASKPLMTQVDWQAFSPATIDGYYWQGKCLGFYAANKGFLFDMGSGNFQTLDFSADAGCYDHTDGTLYLVIGNNIYGFNNGDEYRSIEYMTKLFRYKPNCFKCGEVIAKEYPVTLDIIYPEVPRAFPVTVTSSKPFRIPKMTAEACQVRVYGARGLSIIHLANVMEEIPE